MIYRLPNLFGKWCRPNYNSAVATFCHNIARDLPITVSDPAVELELVYIDDLIDEILNAMEGHPHRTDGAYCSVPVSHRMTLGKIVRLLQTFHDQPQTLLLPESRRAALRRSSTAPTFPICRRRKSHSR